MVGMSAFARFQDITGPTYYSSKEDCINDAQKTNTNTLGYLLRGQQMSDTLQGGSSIRDNIQLSTTRIARFYAVDETETYQAPQPTATWIGYWRFARTYVTWTDQQIELNDVSGDLTHIFKSEWYKIQQEMWTDWFNFLEEAAWAVPNKSKMEAADGTDFMSIPALVNEHTNGLAVPGAANGGTWTTVQQLAPTDSGKENWVPTRRSYAALIASGATSGLVSAFDKVFMQTDFSPPPMKAEYYESPTAQPSGCIFTSLAGVANAQFAYRSENDHWSNMNDPYGRPLYGGRPFVYIKQLDTAAIFPTSTAGAYSTELVTTNSNAGPRYFGIQPKYMRMVFKNTRFQKDLGELTPYDAPHRHSRPMDTWGNLIARSRLRHFIVYPSANITSA